MNKKASKAVLDGNKTDFLLSIGVPLILLIAWELAGDNGLLNGSIMPAPSKIGNTLYDMVESGRLWRNFSISMDRVIKGFVLGASLGIIIGSLMGIFHKVDKALGALTGILRPIPIIGWVPLFILWMGIGEVSKITIVAFGTFWSVLINTTDGIKNVDIKYIEVASILEKSKFTTLTKVIIPSALPSILTGLRLGFGNAWRSIVSAEMLAASRGIGYLISYARELSKPADMMVGLLTIGLIGLLIDAVIIKIQNKVFSWNS